MKITRVLKNEYLDSLVLMDLSLDVSGWPGVKQAVVIMGTDSNRRILEELGLLVGEARTASRHDLILAAEVDEPLGEVEFLGRIDERIKRQHKGPSGGERFADLGAALDSKPKARLVSISVPGEYAASLARTALQHDRHVFCFSNHVSVEDELALKTLAVARGLLMMGPDCGTAILDGCGLGFANQVRRGSIGVVSASGSGLQEVTTLIHRHGGGISQAIGVGGRDMRDPVNGLMSAAAVRMLGSMPETRVIVLLAKSASARARTRVLEAARIIGLPVVVDFLSEDGGAQDRGDVRVADTFEACAAAALEAAGIASEETQPDAEEAAHLNDGSAKWPLRGSLIRGLFAGGSLCAEAARILGQGGVRVATNLDQPLTPLPDQHVLLDLGAEEYTEGRPHPFIDHRLRNLEIERAFAHGSVGVLLLDVVLGWGCEADPAGAVASALKQARLNEAGGPLVIASVCGTDQDPQRFDVQCGRLRDAGVVVAGSNASAARLALRAIGAQGSLS